MDKQWHNTPPAIRDDYGARKSEGLKKSIDAFLDLSFPDINDVVNTIIEAITVGHPEPYYPVCKPLTKAICIDALSPLPEEVQDIFLSEPIQSTTFRALKTIRDTFNIW